MGAAAGAVPGADEPSEPLEPGERQQRQAGGEQLEPPELVGEGEPPVDEGAQPVVTPTRSAHDLVGPHAGKGARR
jgi:hypothetical protein